MAEGGSRAESNLGRKLFWRVISPRTEVLKRVISPRTEVLKSVISPRTEVFKE